MEKPGGRAAGAGMGRARRNETLLREHALSEFKRCKWGVGRVEQHAEIPFRCTNGGQAMATLTPAGQLGTPEGFGLFDGRRGKIQEIKKEQINQTNQKRSLEEHLMQSSKDKSDVRQQTVTINGGKLDLAVRRHKHR